MKSTAKLNWLKDKEKEFRKTGKLDVSGEMLENLSFIGSRPTMKTLDLSFTSIRSFEGLPQQPKLEYLILDGSTIESFKNGFSISSISKISIRNTPISKIPNYKISLLLICDKNLRIIDDRIIPSKLKQKAEKYPPICRKLVNQGWIAQYPCPSESDLIDLCFNYGINYQDEIQDKNASSINEIPLYEEKDIDEIISKYSSKHKKMLQKAQEKLENYDDIKNDPYNSKCSTSIDLDITSENSSVNTIQEYTFNAYNANDNYNYQSQLSYPQDEEERNESILGFNPNLLSHRVCEIIKRYGFDVDDDEDRVSAIIDSLTHIFQVAEGNDVDFPHVLMDGNIIALDDDFEEDEEESFHSEDFSNIPKKARTNVTFDFSNQENKIKDDYIPSSKSHDDDEFNEFDLNIQNDHSDHLNYEYNEEEEKIQVEIDQSSSQQQQQILSNRNENENDAEQRKDEVEGESSLSISAIEGEKQVNFSLLQQQKQLMQDDNDNEIENKNEQNPEQSLNENKDQFNFSTNEEEEQFSEDLNFELIQNDNNNNENENENENNAEEEMVEIFNFESNPQTFPEEEQINSDIYQQQNEIETLDISNKEEEEENIESGNNQLDLSKENENNEEAQNDYDDTEISIGNDEPNVSAMEEDY